MNQRHVNDKVEQELEEFKIEINEKVEQNATKGYQFLRPGGERIYLNTDSNVMDASHGDSEYHELPDYTNANRDSDLNMLDHEEPFVGLPQNQDPMPPSNFADAPIKYNELEARKPRGPAEAAPTKPPLNLGNLPYQ